MEKFTKEIVLKALAAGRKFKFVESEKEVDAYYNQKTYAIKKDSEILKELVKELDEVPIKTLIEAEKFPIDNRLLSLREGYYHIIEVYQKEVELKTGTRIENIAFALYREKETGDFWNKIYQVKLQPLVNFISERIFSGDKNIQSIIGKTIRIFSFGLEENTRSYKVLWEGIEEIEIHIEEKEYESYLIEEALQKYEEEKKMNEIDYENFLIDEYQESMDENTMIQEAYIQKSEEEMYYEEMNYNEDEEQLM